MSARSFAENRLVMTHTVIQNTLLRQDCRVFVPIKDLIYRDEGDATQWQSR
jgi:hypothetical protein